MQRIAVDCRARHPIRLSILACFVLLSIGGLVHGQVPDPAYVFGVSQIHPNVPLNGPISSIGVHPGSELTLHVASETGGLFSSLNGGRTWQHEDSLTSERVNAIAYLQTTRHTIIVTAAEQYEANGGGVWIQDGHWRNLASTNPLFPPRGSQCSALAGAWDITIAPDTGRIYVATDCGVAVGSADAVTWHHLEVPGTSELRSIVALGAGHLIAGGPAGFWYSRNIEQADGAVVWRRETTGIGGLSNIHGLSRDPRGGDRAYAVNESRQLFESTDGGSTWSRITTDPPASYNCGGIAFTKAVTAGSVIRLYFGDRCDTQMTSFAATSEPTQGTRSWSPLSADHGDPADTRDLAFHPGTSNPYLMSSDGGLEKTSNGVTFHWLVRPPSGLDANQITEIRGQYTGTSGYPDLYFATQHNGIWGVSPSRIGGDCPEGWGLGVLRRVPSATGVMITDGCPGHNDLSQQIFQHTEVPEWLNGGGLPSAVVLTQGTYVQQTYTTPGHVRTPGLQYTSNAGETWRQIVDIPDPQRGWPIPAGPSSDPTLVLAIQTGTTDGHQVVGLMRVTGFSSGAMGSKTYARMHGFGSLGVTQTAFAGYEVYAVDPSDPMRMIAADVGPPTNGVKITHDGGDSWREIPGLMELVDHHGAYLPQQPAGDRVSPLVSAISICPDNSSRVLIGTQQGGMYFSYDGGETWGSVTGSERISFATSIFWLDGCGRAWVSTYGRGIWQIRMTPRSPLEWSETLCNHCPFDKITRELLKDSHPDPLVKQTLLVFDGRITSMTTSSGVTLVSLSEGSIPIVVGKLPKLKIIEDKFKKAGLADSFQKTVIQGVVFNKSQVSQITGAAPLVFSPVPPGKLGAGTAESRATGKPVVEVTSSMSVLGTPILKSGEPLFVNVRNTQMSKEALGLQIDGKDVAKVDASQKVFEYIDKTTSWPMGRHVVALVAHGTKGPRTVWVTGFLVPHDDAARKPKAK